jgi:ribonuclease HI
MKNQQQKEKKRKRNKMPATNLFGNDGSNDRLVIYTDGGSRGNPGQAAIGVVVGNKEYGERLGIKTNNEAEYMALVFALKKARQLLGKSKAKNTEVEVRMDSELVVKQLTGIYKILEETLQPFFIEIWNLKLDFRKVAFVHVRREENKRADRLVNQALDAHS